MAFESFRLPLLLLLINFKLKTKNMRKNSVHITWDEASQITKGFKERYKVGSEEAARNLIAKRNKDNISLAVYIDSEGKQIKIHEK